MERKEIFDKFCFIIQDKLGVEASKIKEESHLINDLGADSLDVIEIIMECESQFNISVPDEDIENLTTVKELVDYGYRRLNG